MCPMEEVVRAMNHVINQGWAMYWGTARWTPVEVMEAYTNCRQFNCVTPICEQTEYHHVLSREDGALHAGTVQQDRCRSHDVVSPHDGACVRQVRGRGDASLRESFFQGENRPVRC
ncbi:unnamed protein product, partial [Timema podura]|nr:unnamed protein product [Timema podura]